MTSHEHSVVVGVDWSDSARAAVEHAAEAASDRRLPLRLVHALEPPLYPVRTVLGRVDDLDLLIAGDGLRCRDGGIPAQMSALPDR